VADVLITPLVISSFDLPARKPFFRVAGPDASLEFKKDLDDLDGPDVDLSDAQTSVGAVDLVATALLLDTPLGLVNDGLAFEDADTSLSDFGAESGTSTEIEKSLTTNETNIGNIKTAGNKINFTDTPIAGVGTTPTPPAPAPAPVLPGVGHGFGDAPHIAGTRAAMTNISRPGAPGRFRVGDPWQITIEAAAGSPIYAVATRNGVSLGQSSFGLVPAAGVLVLTGTMSADQIGSWIENWYAGTHFINQIGFSVE
jgi:hypothetical protein